MISKTIILQKNVLKCVVLGLHWSGERLARYAWNAGRSPYRYSCKVAITAYRLYENWNGLTIFRKISQYQISNNIILRPIRVTIISIETQKCYMSLSTIQKYWNYCHKNATMRSLCIVETHVTINTIKMLNFISGFRSDVDAICGLLGYYAASCGNCLPTFRVRYVVLKRR